MKPAVLFTTACLLMLAGVFHANAWMAQGTVFCDADQDGIITTADLRLPNVLVVVTNLSGTYSNATLTAPDGSYVLDLQPIADYYVQFLGLSTLPANPVAVSPPTGTWTFATAPTQQDVTTDFLISSPGCQVTLPVNA